MFGHTSPAYTGKRTKAAMIADVTASQGAAPDKPRTIANNTLEYTAPDGARVIRLHQTDIIRRKGDKVTLSTGGWQSMTTKERLNTFSPFRVGSHKGNWTVTTDAGTFPFSDGCTFDVVTGEPVGRTVANGDKAARQLAADKKLIAAYIKELRANGWGDPAGDPWIAPDAKGLYPDNVVRDWLKSRYVTRLVFVQALTSAHMPAAGVQMMTQDATRRGVDTYGAGKVRRFLMRCLGHA